MFIKIISSIAIVVCCSMLGFHMSYRYTKRITNIVNLRSALSYLETEIIQYSTLLADALKNASKPLSGEWKMFFMKVSGILDDRKDWSLAKAWQISLDDLQNNPYVGKPEYEIIQRFGLQLGSSDKESQGRYFRMTQEQLKTEENGAREVRLKYSRMYRSLGILLGFTIAIILF